MSRKAARELAFKTIFSYDFQADKAQLDALVEILKHEIGEITPEDDEYIQSVVAGVIENQARLDASIQKYLKGWTMDRISKTDLAILRLAVYEIYYREDIPYKVSVNEAIELAKVFSDDSSASFINGVLAGVISEKNQ